VFIVVGPKWTEDNEAPKQHRSKNRTVTAKEFARSSERAMPEAAIKTVCRFIAEDKFIREFA